MKNFIPHTYEFTANTRLSYYRPKSKEGQVLKSLLMSMNMGFGIKKGVVKEEKIKGCRVKAVGEKNKSKIFQTFLEKLKNFFALPNQRKH